MSGERKETEGEIALRLCYQDFSDLEIAKALTSMRGAGAPAVTMEEARDLRQAEFRRRRRARD